MRSWIALGCLLVPLCACASDGGSDTTSNEGSSSGGDESGDTSDAGDTGSEDGDTGDDAGSDGSSESGEESYADPFELVPLDHAWVSSFEAEQTTDGSFDLGEGPFEKVTLIWELESPCFPFSEWDIPAIPSGHNWPAKCDAYDRNAWLKIDPPSADGDPPPFEALRAITPFGGPQREEADITDWANVHPGAHDIRGFVSTWTDGAGQVSGSEGGWWITARIEVVPGPAPREVLDVISIFDGTFGHEDEKLGATFTVPDGATEVRLDYVTSGHGGGEADADCIGHADEFCKREHKVFIDDQEVSTFTPWRDNCTELCTPQTHTWPSGSSFEYCEENPCGNMDSVRAPRANWCPGDAVPPIAGPITSIAPPGEHEFSFSVANVADGGSWPTSATIYIYGD